jgi:hypothetical protein
VGNKVFKASPEEQALVSNILALGDELQAMMSAGGAEPVGGQPPAGGPVEGPGEEGQMDIPSDGNPQNDVAPKGPVAPAAAPRPARDEDNTAIAKAIAGAVMKALGKVNKAEKPAFLEDEVDKAIQKAAVGIAKAMQASNDDGTTANEKAEAKIDGPLPDDDEENIAEVAKDLAGAIYKAIGGRSSVRKSEGGDVVSVLKSMQARQARQDAVIAEILEGIGASSAVEASAPAAGGRVEKALEPRRPVAGYDQGQDFAEMIALGVAKALTGGKVGDRPAASDEFNMPVRKSLQDFTGAFGHMAGGLWGGRG